MVHGLISSTGQSVVMSWRSQHSNRRSFICPGDWLTLSVDPSLRPHLGVQPCHAGTGNCDVLGREHHININMALWLDSHEPPHDLHIDVADHTVASVIGSISDLALRRWGRVVYSLQYVEKERYRNRT